MRHTGESTLLVDVSLDPPDAGMGLFTTAAVPEGAGGAPDQHKAKDGAGSGVCPQQYKTAAWRSYGGML